MKGDDLGKCHVAGIGASINTSSDADRRADVLVLNTPGGFQNIFMIGDTASNVNANDVPWDSAKRVLSFWYKGGFLNCRILLTSSLGERQIDYKFTTGTHSVDGSGNVTFYLGTMPTTVWTRFERNIEEDFEAVSSGTWTNTDRLSIKIPGTYGPGDTWLDDIRLSNSLTSEHNTIGPGAIAHILRHRKINPTTHAVTDRWFHYDQVGSVMNESNSAGTLQTTLHQDAFRNVQSSWDTGLWDAGLCGWNSSRTSFDGGYSYWILLGRVFPRHSFNWISATAGDIEGNSTTVALINETEVTLCLLNPVACLTVWECATHAELSAENSGLPGPRNGPQDAFRHCVWMCCISRLFGTNIADAFAIAHEAGKSDEETSMDMHNNYVGIEAGKTACSRSDCINKCNDAYSEGRLTWIPGRY